jgi:multidrug efflux system membrane fusion protein
VPDVTLAMRDSQFQGGAVVTALPQNGTDEVLGTGKLLVLDNQVDQNTGTIKLKAVFPNADLRLWPGAFVNVRLALHVDQQVITLPVAAIQRGPQGAFVFEVKPGHVVERLAVTVSRQTELLAVVSQGLQPGQVVVTDGASRLTDGSHIQELNKLDNKTTSAGGQG